MPGVMERIPRDPLEARASAAEAQWRAVLSAEDRAGLDGCLPSRRVATITPAPDADVAEARVYVRQLTPRAMAREYQAAIRREVRASAERLYAQRFPAPFPLQVQALLRAPPSFAPSLPRKPGQRSASALSLLVAFLDDSDVLGARRRLSTLDVAIVSLLVDHWPSRVRLRPGLGDLRGDVERVLLAQVGAVEQAMRRYARPSTSYYPTGHVADERASLPTGPAIRVTRNCRVCGSPVPEDADECPGGPATGGQPCGGRSFYWASWQRVVSPRGKANTRRSST